MGWRAAVRIEFERRRAERIAGADTSAEDRSGGCDAGGGRAARGGGDVARAVCGRRLDGLVDEPRPGAPRKIGDEKIAEVVTTTLETMPAAVTHWSTRSMAKATGVSVSTVHRIWRAYSLQPRRSETFKLSTDPLFVEKVRDIVGLYLDPPDRALVLCVDEKSQIQALDRTQPLLPMRPGQAERRTHDYKRHGTTSLFAALDVKAGTIISKCMPRHRAQEFRRFLDTVENNVPADLDIHIVIGQRLEPRDETDPRLVCQAAPLAHPLHPNLLVLDQPGRAVLRASHRTADQARCSPLHQGVRGGNRRLYRRPQRRFQALPLETAEDILASIERFCRRTVAVQAQCG